MTAATRAESWTASRWQGSARWEAWRDALDTTHLPWALEPRSSAAAFEARLAWRGAGNLALVACQCRPCAGQRRKPEIRRTDEARFGLLLLLGGSEVVRQGEVSTFLGPGDLFLWDSAQAIDFEVRAALRKVTLLLPKQALAPLLPRGAKTAPLVLPKETPETALLASYLETLSGVMPDQEETTWQRSAAIAQELLVNAVSTDRPLPAESRGEALRLTVEADIRRNARDPRLAPAWLARRQGVTARYLHMLFAERPYTLSALIRNERLEGAHREILASDGRGVTEIAYDWGFQSPAHFSRCFKQRFGLSPSALRRDAACAR